MRAFSCLNHGCLVVGVMCDSRVPFSVASRLCEWRSFGDMLPD